MLDLFPSIQKLVVEIHGIVRWLVIISALFALFRFYRGWQKSEKWQPLDKTAGALFTGILDLQVLLGILLYLFFSPKVREAFTNFSGIQAYFFGAIHLLAMIIAVIIAHIGWKKAQTAHEDGLKFKTASSWFSMALLIIILAIPWVI